MSTCMLFFLQKVSWGWFSHGFLLQWFQNIWHIWRHPVARHLFRWGYIFYGEPGLYTPIHSIFLMFVPLRAISSSLYIYIYTPHNIQYVYSMCEQLKDSIQTPVDPNIRPRSNPMVGPPTVPWVSPFRCLSFLSAFGPRGLHLTWLPCDDRAVWKITRMAGGTRDSGGDDQKPLVGWLQKTDHAQIVFQSQEQQFHLKPKGATRRSQAKRPPNGLQTRTQDYSIDLATWKLFASWFTCAWELLLRYLCLGLPLWSLEQWENIWQIRASPKSIKLHPNISQYCI